jgi:hypothetical protein
MACRDMSMSVGGPVAKRSKSGAVAVLEHGTKGSDDYYKYHPGAGEGVPLGTDPEDAITPHRATRLAKAGIAGGFTARIFGDESALGRYLVSPYKEFEEVVEVTEMDREKVRQFIAAHVDPLSKRDHYLGGWFDEGKVYLDVSVAEDDLDRAMALARSNNQLAIWDRKTNTPIRVQEADVGPGRRFAILVLPAADTDIDAFVDYLTGGAGEEPEMDQPSMMESYVDIAILALDMAEASPGSAPAQAAKGPGTSSRDPVAARAVSLGAPAHMLDTDPAKAALADLRNLRMRRMAGVNLSDDEVKVALRARLTLRYGAPPTEAAVEAAFRRLVPDMLPGADPAPIRRGQEVVDPGKQKEEAIAAAKMKQEVKAAVETPTEVKEHGDKNDPNYRSEFHPGDGHKVGLPRFEGGAKPRCTKCLHPITTRYSQGSRWEHLRDGDTARTFTMSGMFEADTESMAERDFSAGEREKAADKGQAMGDGSFPIKNAEDLKNAIRLVGRAKDPAAARHHIIKRAQALGLTDQLPDGWTSDHAEHGDPSRPNYRQLHPKGRGWSGPPPPGAGPIGHPVGSERYNLEYERGSQSDDRSWHMISTLDPDDARRPAEVPPPPRPGLRRHAVEDESNTAANRTALRLENEGYDVEVRQFKGGWAIYKSQSREAMGTVVGTFDSEKAVTVAESLRAQGYGVRLEPDDDDFRVVRLDAEVNDMASSESVDPEAIRATLEQHGVPPTPALIAGLAEHGTKGEPGYSKYHPETAGSSGAGAGVFGVPHRNPDERWEWEGKRPTNPMGRSRPVDKPYLTFKNMNGFEYRVLKSYQLNDEKPFARWFTATRSPYTMGSWELGDAYVADVVSGSQLTHKDDALGGDWQVPKATRGRSLFGLFGEAHTDSDDDYEHCGDYAEGEGGKCANCRKSKSAHMAEAEVVEVNASAPAEPMTFRESGIGGEMVTLREAGAVFNDATREVWITPIRPGWGNPRDGFYYTEEALKAAVNDGIFNGRKMYANHPRRSDEKELPERDVRDWVATVKETVWDNQRRQPRSRLRVYDKGAYERFKDAPDEIAFSILGGGVARPGKVGNREARIVEALKKIRSIDWVTEAGAGGAIDFAESAHEEFEMDLNNLTAEQLRDGNPALYAALTGVKESEGDPEGQPEPEQDEIAALRAEVAELRAEQDKTRVKEAAAEANKDAIAFAESVVGETLLPKVAKDAVVSRFKEATVGEGFLFPTKEGLKAAIEREIAEMDKVVSVARGRAPHANLGTPPPDAQQGTGKAAAAVQTMEARFEEKMGVVPKGEGIAAISEASQSVAERMDARI